MKAKNRNKVIGYIRVSTVDQNTEKNEADILKFANQNDFGKVEFVKEKISGLKSWKKRKLYETVQSLQKDDVLIVPELSRLGRSLTDVLDVLNQLTEKEVKVYSVKENFQLNGLDMQSKIMRTMLGLFSEIERDLISARVREGQAEARKKGRTGGRPKGYHFSKLDKYKEEIIALLKTGVKKNYIAKKYDVNPGTLWNWQKRNNLDSLKPEH